MKSRTVIAILGLAFVALYASSMALANDNIISTVTIPDGQPVPIIETNGVAAGTIRLTYTYVGNSFPCGPFAQFSLGMLVAAGSGKQPSVYPADLSLAQTGSGTPVQLSSDPPALSVTGSAWSASSLVTVSIDCSKLSATPEDGDVIDGQISLSIPGNAHIGTITSIQVHIKLEVPTACVKLYSFESDQDTGTLLNSVTVNVKKSGEVVGITGGQVSVDALVSNTCSQPVSFDLLIGMDSHWQTNPQGNPGNAVFSFTLAGEYDPADTFSDLSGGTKQGQLLCLSNVTLAEGNSFLARVHSDIKSGIATTTLPSGGFVFGAMLYEAGSGCSGTPLGSVTPENPAISTLTFTTSR